MADTELSEFQTDKIVRVFYKLYDTNKDGVIEEKDFDEAINKICTIHKWPTDGERYRVAKETLDLIWEGLKGIADANEDGKVTKEEWCQMWATCVNDVKTGKGFPDWQKKYMEFMFRVNDTSGDGLIDVDEYTQIYTEFGCGEEECRSAFNKLTQGRDGKITKSDYEELWKEYFVSDDKTARGNYLFGRPPF